MLCRPEDFNTSRVPVLFLFQTNFSKMSWFSHVSQTSNQQQLTGTRGPTATNNLFSTHNRGPAERPMATNDWSGLSSPSLNDFPAVPQAVNCPPRLGNMSFASQSAGQVREAEPISYVTLQEQRCVLSWFQGWTSVQREQFLQDLVGKAVPGKVCTLLDSLSSLQVKDSLPNIFECQLRLWTQWFESWDEEDRNHFLHMLEERDPVFVGHFYQCVAGTAGRD